MRMELRHNRILNKHICISCGRKGQSKWNGISKSLPVWIDEHNHVHHELPPQLQNLRKGEKLLIAMVSAYVPLHHLKKGQLGCKGHVCCFTKDLSDVCTTLPRLPSNVQLVKVIKRYKDDDGEINTKTFKIRKQVVLDALYWLKKYHKFYKDITIATSNLDWMEGQEEKELPCDVQEDIMEQKQQQTKTATTKEEEEEGDSELVVEEDRGPSEAQISTVLDKEEYHDEVVGGMTQNYTGDTMTGKQDIHTKITISLQNTK